MGLTYLVNRIEEGQAVSSSKALYHISIFEKQVLVVVAIETKVKSYSLQTYSFNQVGFLTVSWVVKSCLIEKIGFVATLFSRTSSIFPPCI